MSDMDSILTERERARSQCDLWPLLRLHRATLDLLLLQASPHLLQLDEGAGGGVGRHGGVLDEGVRRQHVGAPQLGTAATDEGVQGARSLPGEEARRTIVSRRRRCPLGPRATPGRSSGKISDLVANKDMCLWLLEHQNFNDLRPLDLTVKPHESVNTGIHWQLWLKHYQSKCWENCYINPKKKRNILNIIR